MHWHHIALALIRASVEEQSTMFENSFPDVLVFWNLPFQVFSFLIVIVLIEKSSPKLQTQTWEICSAHTCYVLFLPESAKQVHCSLWSCSRILCCSRSWNIRYIRSKRGSGWPLPAPAENPRAQVFHPLGHLLNLVKLDFGQHRFGSFEMYRQ